mmetsp:Transcript_27713/g.42005  ORF Transcript_27713/g.42005 Transcript_27713/m.42005 type:complete len:88 (+) Transcript_27713:61-324(+)
MKPLQIQKVESSNPSIGIVNEVEKLKFTSDLKADYVEEKQDGELSKQTTKKAHFKTKVSSRNSKLLTPEGEIEDGIKRGSTRRNPGL